MHNPYLNIIALIQFYKIFHLNHHQISILIYIKILKIYNLIFVIIHYLKTLNHIQKLQPQVNYINSNLLEYHYIKKKYSKIHYSIKESPLSSSPSLMSLIISSKHINIYQILSNMLLIIILSYSKSSSPNIHYNLIYPIKINNYYIKIIH